MAGNQTAKGILGQSIGLITKGILDEPQLIIVTKKGRIIKRGGGAILGGKGYYDKDYYKRLRKDLEEDGDEIETITVKIKKKHLTKKYKIHAELVKPQVEAQLLKAGLFEKDNIPKIEIELLESELVDHPKVIKAELVDTYKTENYPKIIKAELVNTNKKTQ